MRKFYSTIDKNATASTASPLLPPPPRLLPPLPSPSPSPSNNYNYYNTHHGEGNMFLFPAVHIFDSAFDLTTLSLISSLLLLSLLSLSFIFHLRLKSRRVHHLQNFNSLWPVRLLLVLFASSWALNETSRLPFFHRRYLYPFLPSLPLSKQSNLCKLHVVLSLGVFEPGFFITLLFLVNVSIKKRNQNNIKAIALILFVCLPIFILQTFFVSFSPLGAMLPGIFQTSSVVSIDSLGNEVLMCTYPLFSTMLFCLFVIAYSLAFLFSYWRVVSFVINKGTRVRIYVLAFSILICLPMQVLFLALSSMWRPDNPAYEGLMLGMFVSVTFCFAVGEGIVVIKPIIDALAAGGDCSRWNGLRPLHVVDGTNDHSYGTMRRL